MRFAHTEILAKELSGRFKFAHRKTYEDFLFLSMNYLFLCLFYN
jgi:hypothetical protein